MRISGYTAPWLMPKRSCLGLMVSSRLFSRAISFLHRTSHLAVRSILDEVVPYLPKDRPTYLMGVGTPANILEGVERGVDFFDCVYPSRNGRHGHVCTNACT